jgi:hypothetical protein
VLKFGKGGAAYADERRMRAQFCRAERYFFLVMRREPSLKRTEIISGNIEIGLTATRKYKKNYNYWNHSLSSRKTEFNQQPKG